MFHKEIVAGKKEDSYMFLLEKMDEIYTGDIHVFAKMYKAEYSYCSIGIAARPCSIL